MKTIELTNYRPIPVIKFAISRAIKYGFSAEIIETLETELRLTEIHFEELS